MSDGSTVEIDGVAVPKGQVIVVTDPDPNDNVLISSIEVFKVDGSALKIGLGDIEFQLPPADIQLGFTVQLQDGDNDTTTKDFTVSIDGNNDGSYDATAISAALPATAAALSASVESTAMHSSSAPGSNELSAMLAQLDGLGGSHTGFGSHWAGHLPDISAELALAHSHVDHVIDL